jgi:Kef-type K+ transport system membrane component KefB
MNALLALILIGALGFVFGRFLFLRPRPGSWVERFFLSGVEFLVVGALLGPFGLSILDHKNLASLEPFAVLALTWIGLLMGLQLRYRHLTHFPLTYFRVAVVEGTVALLLAFAALAALFALWTPGEPMSPDRWRAALCLAAVAALSSPSAAALHGPGETRAGHCAGLLRFVPAIDPLISLAGFAFLFAAWHVSSGLLRVAPDTGGWILVSIAGGLTLGFLFLLLLRTTAEGDETMLVVLGMAVFSGGLASVFHLSPLVIGLVAGAVIGNAPRSQERLMPVFLRLERPLYVALLVVAGAAWRFDDPWGYGLAAIYLVVRVAAKYLGIRLALATSPLPFRPPRRWWVGTLPQGALAVAIAVSYGVVYRDVLATRVFSAILVSTALLTLASGQLVATALQPDREPES